MTVSTIESIASGITRSLGNKNTKAADAIRSIVTGATKPTIQDTETFPTTAQLQNQVASLRAATQNIAKTGALLDVAQSGAGEIAQVLGQLQDLATRAKSANLSANERVALNAQVQSLRQQINFIAATANFGGQNLLDGASAAKSADTEPQVDLSIGGLTAKDILGNAALDVSSPQAAAETLAVITKGQGYVAEQQNTIDDIQGDLDYAAVTIETAIQNQDAGRSTITDADFVALAQSESAQSKLQADAISSQFAQTNRLPANILQLLAE